MKIAALVLAALLSACTLTNYGKPPEPVPGAENAWRFRMYVAGPVSGDDSDKAVVEHIEAWRTQKGFKSYRVTARQYNSYPTSYDYFVEFAR